MSSAGQNVTKLFEDQHLSVFFRQNPESRMSFYTHTGEAIAFPEILGSSFLYLNAEIGNICVTVEQEDC